MNLKKIRNERGLSMQGLADKCGIAKQTVWSMEKRGSSPFLFTAYKFANALGVTVQDIWPDPAQNKGE